MVPRLAVEHPLAEFAALQHLPPEHRRLPDLDAGLGEQPDDQRVVRVGDVEPRRHRPDVTHPDGVAVAVLDRDDVRRRFQPLDRLRHHQHALPGGERVALRMRVAGAPDPEHELVDLACDLLDHVVVSVVVRLEAADVKATHA